MTGLPCAPRTLGDAPGGWGEIWPMAKPSPATQTDREVLAGFVRAPGPFHSAETGSCVLRVKARASRPHHNCRHAAGNAKARPDTTTRRVRGDGYYDSGRSIFNREYHSPIPR